MPPEFIPWLKNNAYLNRVPKEQWEAVARIIWETKPDVQNRFLSEQAESQRIQEQPRQMRLAAQEFRPPWELPAGVGVSQQPLTEGRGFQPTYVGEQGLPTPEERTAAEVYAKTKQMQEQAVPSGGIPKGSVSNRFAEILAKATQNKTAQGYSEAMDELMGLLTDTDFELDKEAVAKVDAYITYFNNERTRLEKVGAGGITAGERARQALEEEKFKYGKEQDILNRQRQAEQDRLAIENEKNRIREAMAGLQMQGAGIMGSAYGQALNVYERAARAAIPQGAEYIPGWEPQGAMATAMGKLGASFTPLPASSGTMVKPYEQLPGLLQAIQQIVSGAGAGG